MTSHLEIWWSDRQRQWPNTHLTFHSACGSNDRTRGGRSSYSFPFAMAFRIHSSVAMRHYMAEPVALATGHSLLPFIRRFESKHGAAPRRAVQTWNRSCSVEKSVRQEQPWRLWQSSPKAKRQLAPREKQDPCRKSGSPSNRSESHAI